MSKKKEITKVVQSHNEVGGDLVGRDKNIVNHNYSGQISALRRRSQELTELYCKDGEYRDFIDKLQKYMISPVGVVPRGLEEKLIAGNRDDLVEEAKALKEQFYKKINRNQFSEKAQELFSHILAEIHTFFNSKIRPLIKDGESSTVIDALIYDELIRRIYDDVGDGVLNIDTQDIKGMLFYLTGNCHLEWD